MTTTRILTMQKTHGRYELEDTTSSLRARGGMRRGVITVAGSDYPVHLNDFCRTGATVQAAGIVSVRLDPQHASTPAGAAGWQVGRTFRTYHGVVTQGERQIVVRQPAFVGRSIRVEVTGSWPSEDLVVLAACFVVVSRRRRDRLRMLRIAALTSHGPR